ncbi:MAG UNVERIFIED_CONTAM: hypothetical protein LVR18_27320 [Planctomycetaceae bacterium]|jgi:hypothetical protein
MKGKNFRLGERVVVGMGGRPSAGSISRRLNEAGTYWVVWLPNGDVIHWACRNLNIRRSRQNNSRELSAEELARRTAAIRAEWPEAVRLRRQVAKPEPLRSE